MGGVKERPILFSSSMVRAILSGRKTQTRRVVRLPQTRGVLFKNEWRPFDPSLPEDREGMVATRANPYGQPGDRLWVRETFAPHADEEQAFRNWREDLIGTSAGYVKPEIFYAADGGEPHVNNWRPSIHMPRWASRLTLEVTEVRVQRLQEISEKDAVAEGMTHEFAFEAGIVWRSEDPRPKAVQSFNILWDRINGERPGCSWEANPWVWGISFKVR